jgi:ABC-type bacteriocin/lantibiotic exporter with double-glycine peptidase domain
LKDRHRQLQEDKSTVESQLIEAIANIDVAKSMSLEEMVQQKWHRLFRVFSASNYRAQKLRQLLESSCSGIQFLTTVTLLWYGARLVMDRELTLGQLVAFYMYTSLALPPLLSLVTLWDEWQQARVAMERIQEILDEKPEPQLSPEARIYLQPLEGRVCFQQVCFRYEGAAPVLRGLSFEIRPGERVALVGRSGSGKTTVARLLLGLYQPDQGHVLIDDADLRHLDLLTYRRQIGVVLQENLLLSGSVGDNIALGEPQPDADRVLKAAQEAGAHEFITRLPEGYETRVGEMGLTLSAGERQRISIARALYRNPRILIFDEATSALDSLNEWEIQRNLDTILAGRTTLIITHKMTMMKTAHRILVLHDGLVVEQGTHLELLARRGAYHAMSSQLS